MKIIGVTGTKGKSTTVSIIAHLLRVLGLQTAVGGNIGVPLVDFLGRDTAFDATVAEISSYQAADMEQSPDIGVLLNLYPEHIDWHGSHERYYADKLNLFTNRKDGAPLVANALDARSMSMLGGAQKVVTYNTDAGLHVKDGFIMDSMRRIVALDELKVRGLHNFQNMCAALTVVKLAGLDVFACGEALTSFTGLHHRLQILGERDCITFVNDSISTAPETAIAALNAFADAPVTLIAGGYDRSQDYFALAERVVAHEHPIAVMTMHNTGPRLAAAVQKAAKDKGRDDVIVLETAGLDEAVSKAVENTPKTGVVLMSPAAPSYGAYRNFEERGQHFIRATGFDA